MGCFCWIRGSAIPLKVMDSLTWDELKRLERSTPLKKDDVIYILNPAGAGRSIAEYLIKKSIRAVVSVRELPNLVYDALKEEKIPILYENDVEIKRVDEFAIVDREELEKAIEKRLHEWEEEEKERKVREFLQIVEEYKIERLKELKGKAEKE